MMDPLSRLDKHFRQKERSRLDRIRSENASGLPEMSPEEIRLSCLDNNGYDTPELNDKLYLHFRGFKRIENLEPYTGCRALWLDSNGFERIEGLDKLTQLRCLYLAKNLIGEIKGLECLQQLVTLDLANNRLTMIQGLSCCPLLESVNVSRNALPTPESIVHFQQCPNLKNIDLTNNRLECQEELFSCLAAIPSLVNLSLNGNEFTKMASFRKRMLHELPNLFYLDRPIDEVERLAAEAFFAGGPEAEKVAREEYRVKTAKKRSDEMMIFRQWQQEQSELRAKARAEGRSLMMHTTEEELEARREEAHRDAEEERRILSMGVDKLAQRYWQLEGNSNVVDPLQAAGRALLEEAEDRSEHRIGAGITSDLDNSSRVTEITTDLENKEEEEEEEAEHAHYNTSSVWRPGGGATTAPQSTSPIASATEESKSFEPSPTPPIPSTAAGQQTGSVASANILPPAPPEPEPVQSDPREEYDRQKRVADSMAIYKRQLAVAKAAGKKLTLGTGVSELLAEHGATEATINNPISAAPLPAVIALKGKSTWDAAEAGSKGESQGRSGKTYWTEDMDIELAKEVRSRMFDFDAVAAALLAATGPGGKLEKSTLRSGLNTSALNSDACRLRWAELDAEKWSTMAPSATPMDTNFNVYVTPQMINAAQGHGGQPSYAALATMAAGSLPTYLTPPTSFPSVADISDEEEDDEDIKPFVVPPPPIPVNLEAMD